MLDYRMQQNYPMAAVIQAYAEKPVREAQIRAAQAQQDAIRQKQMTDSIGQIGSAINTAAESRRRMAAAMTMAQNPNIQKVLGGDQMVPGSIPSDPNQQIATGYGGQSVTPGMTAQGGVGVPPVQNTTATYRPALTPKEILPMLSTGAGNPDYMGDIQKANDYAQKQNDYTLKQNDDARKTSIQERLQQMFENSGNVVTPVVKPDGSVEYHTTSVTPGSKVSTPTRLPDPNAGGRGRGSGQGGFSPNQRRIQQLQVQFKNLQGQLSSAVGPDRDAIVAQMQPISDEINAGLRIPSGTPGANQTTGSPMPAGGGDDSAPPPEALQHIQEGKTTTFKNGQTWTRIKGQFHRVS